MLANALIPERKITHRRRSARRSSVFGNALGNAAVREINGRSEKPDASYLSGDDLAPFVGTADGAITAFGDQNPGMFGARPYGQDGLPPRNEPDGNQDFLTLANALDEFIDPFVAAETGHADAWESSQFFGSSLLGPLGKAFTVAGFELDYLRGSVVDTIKAIPALAEFALEVNSAKQRAVQDVAQFAFDLGSDWINGDWKSAQQRIADLRGSVADHLEEYGDKGEAILHNLTLANEIISDPRGRDVINTAFNRLKGSVSKPTLLFTGAAVVSEILLAVGTGGVAAEARATTVGVKNGLKTVEVVKEIRETSRFERLALVFRAVGESRYFARVSRAASKELGYDVTKLAIVRGEKEAGRLGLISGIRNMHREGWKVLDESFQYGNGQGVDAVFTRAGADGANEFAVLESKGGGQRWSTILAPDAKGLVQGTGAYNIDRLKNFIRLAESPTSKTTASPETIAKARMLLGEFENNRVSSYLGRGDGAAAMLYRVTLPASVPARAMEFSFGSANWLKYFHAAIRR